MENKLQSILHGDLPFIILFRNRTVLYSPIHLCDRDIIVKILNLEMEEQQINS